MQLGDLPDEILVMLFTHACSSPTQHVLQFVQHKWHAIVASERQRQRALALKRGIHQPHCCCRCCESARECMLTFANAQVDSGCWCTGRNPIYRSGRWDLITMPLQRQPRTAIRHASKVSRPPMDSTLAAAHMGAPRRRPFWACSDGSTEAACLGHGAFVEG